MELCNVCEKHIESASMQFHVLGKKHLKKANEQEKYNRSILVKVPNSVSKAQLYAYFAKYGTIKYRKVTKAGAIIEYQEKEIAESLVNTPLYMNRTKLQLEKLKQDEETQENDPEAVIEKLRKKCPIDYTNAISYDKIEKFINQESGFDRQFWALLNAIQLSNEELYLSYNIVSHQLNIIFYRIFPRSVTYKFGSTQMGLGFKDSDLDIFMDIGQPVCDSNKSQPGLTTNQIFGKLRKTLYRLKAFFSDIVWIRNARVPIIKFRYIPTNVSCDLSFKNSLGVHKTELVKHCLSLDNRATPLMILIKYWSRHFKLSTNGLLRNYVLTLMVIFFLQQPSINIVPSIVDLQEGSLEQWVDGWRVNFNTTYEKQTNTNTSSLPQLLHQFFSFYSTFDFRSQVICLLCGVAHPRGIFAEQNHVPACVSRYNEFRRLNPDVPEILTNNCEMCIQDPIELINNNAGRLSSRKLQEFLDLCEVGAQVCATAAKEDNKELLSSLFITIPTDSNAKGQIAVKFVLGLTSVDSREEYWPLVYQCVKSVLEELFNLQIEVITSSESIQKRVLKCTGWFPDAVSGPNDEENSKLDFIYYLKLKSCPMEFDVIFTNQKTCDEIFTKFVKSLNIKMSPIIYRRLHNAITSSD